MFYLKLLFVFLLFLNEIYCLNVSDLLTSSYAKVSHSGATNKTNNENEGRSHGQTPWTHSSDVNIIRGQNLPQLLRPRLQLQLKQNQNKKDISITHNRNNDNVGEVIQDRFNPKPWFGYEPSSSNTKSPPDPDLQVPFDSFPLALKPDNTNTNNNDNIKNSYGSMYTSYDPPPAPALNQKNPNPDNFVTYEPPTKLIKPPKYLPPPPSTNPEQSDNQPQAQPNMQSTDTDTDDGPPISQAYNHPYHSHNHHHQDDQNSNDDDDDDSIKDTPTKYLGLPAYLDHHPNEHEQNYYLSNIHGHPQPYQHHYHHDHDDHGPIIYHEIKATTEAPQEMEDQRLNKKPYSYYYLGRKLWYIPLYFSVYFIIYIFVLILKSIARHKITFNHYFEDDKREMKDTMPMPMPHPEVVHELGDHVWSDIHAAKRKYHM